MKMRTIPPKKAGQKPIKFREGGEHASLGVPAGKKIPVKKAAAALKGSYGPKAAKQERFRRNVLTGRKKP